MQRGSLGSRLLAFAALLLSLGAGCRCTRTPPPAEVRLPEPSVRLYLVSSLAGALEPCGCVKDMLGGVDHFAALLESERKGAPRRLVLGAGPMLFMDPELDPKRREQDITKGRALADILHETSVVGWAPAANDWAGGAELLGELTRDRLSLFAANLEGPLFRAGRVVELGGERVGITGVSLPGFRGAPPPGVVPGDARAALEREKTALVAAGARILVALLAVPRGDALRLAEAVPGFHVFVLGKPVDRGETNDRPTPPVLVGDTLVVEGPNHLQSVAVVDLHVQDGRYRFADGTGVADEEQRLSVKQRIVEVRAAIDRAGVSAADRAARRGELARLEAESKKLSAPRAPPNESFFGYRLVEVREKLGTEPKTQARLAAYYKTVNEHNRVAFADVRPKEAAAGQSSYVGVTACTACHHSERTFWDRTAHAAAYTTLTRQDKEFNLECVSCHVTGYDVPGGSTVTHVKGLEHVQCEVCHGPGSRHVGNPTDKTLIATPARNVCAEQCHHPPHVHPGWSVDEAWNLILGPGHGHGR